MATDQRMIAQGQSEAKDLLEAAPRRNRAGAGQGGDDRGQDHGHTEGMFNTLKWLVILWM